MNGADPWWGYFLFGLLRAMIKTITAVMTTMTITSP